MKKIIDVDFLLFSALSFIFFVITSVLFKFYMFFNINNTFLDLNFRSMIVSILYGVKFDCSISSILLMPLLTFFLFWNKKKGHINFVWIIFPFSILLLGLFGDLIYLENTGKHVGYEVHQILDDAKELILNFFFGYKMYAFLLVLLISIVLLIIQGRSISFREDKKRIFIPKLIVLYVFLFFSARGAIFDTPLTPNMAYRVGTTDGAKLALNGAYAALYYLIKNDHNTTINYAEKWTADFSYLKDISAMNNQEQEFKAIKNKKNVVIVLLESWSGQYVHSINSDSKIITPFFDSLNQKGLSTEAMFAGGVRTHEGMYSILCSQQNPLGAGIPETFLQSYSYKCLPEILRKSGLSVSMFQGSHTKLVGDFALFLGANQSFGKLDIPSGQLEKNYWGYQDPDLYNFVISKAKKETQPFFYIINTTTTHDLVLPKNVKWVFGSRTLDEKRKSVLHYADMALSEFVSHWLKEIKEPTLFVFVADHTAGGSDQIKQFVIPFVMFATDGSVNKSRQDGISSQRDIAPTIIDNLGGYVPWFSGSVLGKDSYHYADFYSNGYLGFAYNKKIASFNVFDNEKTKCYEWSDNIFNSHVTACDKALINKGIAFTKYSQSLLFSGKTSQYGMDK